MGAWAGGFIAGSTSSSQLDVHSGYFELLESVDDVNSGKHSSIRGRFVSIRSNFHSSSDSGESFSTSEVSNVNEGIIPGGEDVADGENIS